MSSPNKTRVAIIIEHGMPDRIYSNDPDAEVTVIDLDNEYSDNAEYAQQELERINNDPDMKQIQ